jgi:hypothetical protein
MSYDDDFENYEDDFQDFHDNASIGIDEYGTGAFRDSIVTTLLS